MLRVIVPDAERYLRAYCREDLEGFRDLAVPDPFPEDLPTRMDVINHVFHQWHEHRWAYDFETLGHRLRGAGFDRIVRSEYKVSLDSELGQDRNEARAVLAVRRGGEVAVTKAGSRWGTLGRGGP